MFRTEFASSDEFDDHLFACIAVKDDYIITKTVVWLCDLDFTAKYIFNRPVDEIITFIERLVKHDDVLTPHQTTDILIGMCPSDDKKPGMSAAIMKYLYRTPNVFNSLINRCMPLMTLEDVVTEINKCTWSTRDKQNCICDLKRYTKGSLAEKMLLTYYDRHWQETQFRLDRARQIQFRLRKDVTIRVFLSHAGSIKYNFVCWLDKELRSMQIPSVTIETFFDARSLRWGHHVDETIDREIVQCDFAMLILDHTYFWQEYPVREAHKCIDRMTKQQILPVFYDIQPESAAEQELLDYKCSVLPKLEAPDVKLFNDIRELAGHKRSNCKNGCNRKLDSEFVNDLIDEFRMIIKTFAYHKSLEPEC